MNSEEKSTGSLLFPGVFCCKKDFAFFGLVLPAMEKIRLQFSDDPSSVALS